jgi:hypothetical protein
MVFCVACCAEGMLRKFMEHFRNYSEDHCFEYEALKREFMSKGFDEYTVDQHMAKV